MPLYQPMTGRYRSQWLAKVICAASSRFCPFARYVPPAIIPSSTTIPTIKGNTYGFNFSCVVQTVYVNTIISLWNTRSRIHPAKMATTADAPNPIFTTRFGIWKTRYMDAKTVATIWKLSRNINTDCGFIGAVNNRFTSAIWKISVPSLEPEYIPQSNIARKTIITPAST